jgi:hypothetical protein
MGRYSNPSEFCYNQVSFYNRKKILLWEPLGIHIHKGYQDIWGKKNKQAT